MGFLGLFKKKKSYEEIKEIVINEMLKMEIQIAKDKLKNNWTREEEGEIFRKRILKNKTIQSLNKHFTQEDLINVLLPEVEKRFKNYSD